MPVWSSAIYTLHGESPVMGCCCCCCLSLPSISRLMKDPEVVTVSAVGATAIVCGSQELTNTCVRGGRLYVRGGHLYYHSRSCLGRITRESWPLSDIKEAAAVRDENIHPSVNMDPGLQVIFKDASILVCSTPQYALEFSRNLNKRIRAHRPPEPEQTLPPKR
jgi:hypothetical protein